MFKVVSPPPSWNGTHDAYQNGLEGVFWVLDVVPDLWCLKTTPDISYHIFTWENPTEDYTMGGFNLVISFVYVTLLVTIVQSLLHARSG